MLWKIFGKQNANREFVPVTTDDADEAINEAEPGTVIVADPDGDNPQVFKSMKSGDESWWKKLGD